MAETETVEATSLLDQALLSTAAIDRDYSGMMLRAFCDQATEGGMTWTKNVTGSIEAAIRQLDGKISEQLSEVLHADELQTLEGTWRGLHHLVSNTETGTRLKIKVLNAPKSDLYKDLDGAMDFDQSELFKKVYESEYGTPGGEPYSVLLGDYFFRNHPDDINFLQCIAGVAAAAFAPFISSADASLCGLDSWTGLAKPRDLAQSFESVEFASWRGFRQTEDARYVTLTLPRVLARLPYGENTKPIEEFHFEEVALTDEGKWAKPVDHSSYTWMNASWVLGARLTEAFAKYGWCTAIRGAEGGGIVSGLPAHTFVSDDGDLDLKCPTEIGITDRREAELSEMGFLPLCHYKNTDFAVFFGGQTTQKPVVYDDPDATANAAISARLPCILASARMAHYLKVIARDKIGSFMELSDCEIFLNRWINQYIVGNASPTAEMKAMFPLAAAKISVQEVPGRPGSFQAIAWLRPWLQLEELTTSIRLVANIP
jgi:type VI secretion system protein ImpC